MAGSCPVYDNVDDIRDYPIVIRCGTKHESSRIGWCIDNLDPNNWCFDPYIIHGHDFMFKNSEDAILFKLTFGGVTK